MDLEQRLAGHTTLGLDTCIFIYHFEANPRYLPCTQALLGGIQVGRWKAVTSVLTVMEVTVRPWQLQRPAVAREYEALLAHFPQLALADITRETARRAAQLRAAHRLRPADALQVAAASLHGATAFVSNDHQLLRLGSLVDLILLDELT